MTRAIKRVTALSAQTAVGFSNAINVTDFETINFTHSTAASSDQVVKLMGALSASNASEPVAPTFSSAKAVGNEWDYVESLDLQSTGTAIAGDTGVTFAGVDVKNFTANVAGLDWIAFHVSTGTAGALTTNVVCYNN